jgi:hypothetical protein
LSKFDSAKQSVTSGINEVRQIGQGNVDQAQFKAKVLDQYQEAINSRMAAKQEYIRLSQSPVDGRGRAGSDLLNRFNRAITSLQNTLNGTQKTDFTQLQKNVESARSDMSSWNPFGGNHLKGEDAVTVPPGILDDVASPIATAERQGQTRNNDRSRLTGRPGQGTAPQSGQGTTGQPLASDVPHIPQEDLRAHQRRDAQTVAAFDRVLRGVAQEARNDLRGANQYASSKALLRALELGAAGSYADGDFLKNAVYNFGWDRVLGKPDRKRSTPGGERHMGPRSTGQRRSQQRRNVYGGRCQAPAYQS